MGDGNENEEYYCMQSDGDTMSINNLHIHSVLFYE